DCVQLSGRKGLYGSRGVDVPQLPLAHAGQWHRSTNGICLCPAVAFEAIKEEELVLLDRSSEAATKDIAHLLRSGNAGPTIEEVICIENRILVLFKRRTVERVGATLSEQIDLCCRRASLLCVGVQSGDTKFFDRFRI